MGLIRLILAYAVVLNHSKPIHGYFLIRSSCAVTLFFMISGFYMALVTAEKYTGPGGIREFYSNRILRLYPMYFVSLVLMITTQYYLHHKSSGGYISAWQANYAQLPWSVKLPLLVPNITLVGSDIPWMFYYGNKSGWHFRLGQVSETTDSVRMSQYILVYPAWSIGLELWFYLLVPFFALWRTSSLVIVSAVSFSLRFAMEWNAPWSSYFFFPANLCFFVVGMLAYRVYRSERYQHVTTRPQAKLVLVVFVLTLLFRQYIPVYKNYDWLVYTLFGVTLPWLFYASKHWRLDRWVGNLSYPVYLLHASILLLLGVRFGTDDGLLAVGLSTSAALAFLVTVERRLEQVRQRRVANALAVKHTEPRMTLSLVLEVPQKASSS